MHPKILPLSNTRSLLYILGLNSGTSADGLDIALTRFTPGKLPEMLDCRTYAYPKLLRKRIIACGESNFRDGEAWLALDRDLGITMGKLVSRFIKNIKSVRIDLIGSHGQTIRHLPRETGTPLTLQIGEATHIARITGVSVVSDFRRSDLAAGGEGAPLSPILHEALFRVKEKWRAIVNIGGIANITLLPPKESNQKTLAGDSGPGNMAIDLAMSRYYGKPYDTNGQNARKGSVNTSYVLKTLGSPYFQMRPPKSTGRELFGANFLQNAMNALPDSSPENIIATLSEITVASIAHFILSYTPSMDEIYLCGGGARNRYIVNRLHQIFKGIRIETTAALGYDPDYLEALLWAYLANCFVRGIPVNSGNFTGASKPYIPGKLCHP
jgi:anhydro-N-acetylmuramic acid kinase